MPLFNPKPGSTFLATLFSKLPTPATDRHITVNTHLTSDLFAISLTIDAGITLFTDNYRIFVLTKLTNNGTISNIGGNGGNGTALAGGSAGINPNDKIFVAGTQGNNGVFNNNNGNAGFPGDSCIGMLGSDGGTALVKSGGLGGPANRHQLSMTWLNAIASLTDISFILAHSTIDLQTNGGAGSGAADLGNAGSGGSGASGGFIAIYATVLINIGTITAKGGNAGSSFDDGITPVGGSAGGNGGIIILFTNTLTSGTLNVTPGNFSIGVHGADSGQPAADGYIYLNYLA